MREAFDLKRALNGEKVVNRIGEEVTDIKYFPNIEVDHKVVGIHKGCLFLFLVNGRYDNEYKEYVMDLFMSPPEIKKYFLNIYKTRQGEYYCSQLWNDNNMPPHKEADFVKTITLDL